MYGLPKDLSRFAVPLGTYYGTYRSSTGQQVPLRARGVVVPMPRDLRSLHAKSAASPRRTTTITVAVAPDVPVCRMPLTRIAGSKYAYEDNDGFVCMLLDIRYDATNGCAPLLFGAQVCSALGCGRPR